MFNIIEELWKAQQYVLCECNFEVPQTYLLQGNKISHFFTSSQCPGKILKKRKENVSLNNILDSFNGKDKYVCSFQRLLNKKDVHFKYLTRSELESLIEDAQQYPDLYQDVILQQMYSSENYITYHKNGHITQIQQRIPLCLEPLITLSDSQFACDKVIFENRINKIGQSIENMISITQENKVKEIEIFIKCINDKLIVVWNTNIKCGSKSNQLNFQHSYHFLYNQALYEMYQVKHKIKEEQQMIQCSSCRKLINYTDTFDVLKNRIWKIRMHRNLHHLNDQQVICDSNGRIQTRMDEFQFVKVCGLCYNSFIDTISNNGMNTTNTKLRIKKPQKEQFIMQRFPRRKLFKFGENNDAKSYLGSRTNSTQIKDRRMTPILINSTFDEAYDNQENLISMQQPSEDFDQLLQQVKNDQIYKSNIRNRIQSAQQTNKFKLYYQ